MIRTPVFSDRTEFSVTTGATVRWALFSQLDYKDAEEENWRTASSLFVHAQPSCGTPPEQVSKVFTAYAFTEVRALHPR